MKTNRKPTPFRKNGITWIGKAEPGDKSRADFLSDISHEIRTPIGAIVGLTDLLLTTKLDDKQKQCLTLMQGSANALMEMIDKLLDISKIESGVMAHEYATFNITELLEEIVGIMSIQAQEKGIGLDLHYETRSPEIFIGDSGSIRQIVINLVGNAIKFTDAGSVKLSFVTSGKENGKERIAIAVMDTGIGISLDKIDVIFERFVQADSSIMRKYGGTGLGLAISKALAENMGGSITVTSTVNRGSTFLLKLQLAEGMDENKKDRQENIIYLDTSAKRHLMNVKSEM